MEKPKLQIPFVVVNGHLILNPKYIQGATIPDGVYFEKEELKARIECLISELNYNLCYTENKEFTIEKIKEAFKEILEE